MAEKSREQLNRMRRWEAARRRNLTVSAVMVAVIVLVVAVGVAVQMGRSDTSAATGDASPQGTVDRYAIPRGEAAAPVTLTMYEDFQCPVCRSVEGVLGSTIDRFVEADTVRVDYRPIAFLDEASTTGYSSHALNAAACVLDDAGRDGFVRMHTLLFVNQPPEGTAGLSDGRLLRLAEQAGAQPASVRSCIEQERFRGWAEAATEQASVDGVNATPTILVNGEQLQFTQDENPVATLRQAVQSAQATG